jgi:hypothetical protein
MASKDYDPKVPSLGTNTKRGKEMEPAEFRLALYQKVHHSTEYFEGVYTFDRVDAQQYYEGLRPAKEKKGRSGFIAREFAEAVDTMMPGLLRVFGNGDETVRFVAQNPKDDLLARQATDYANYIFNVKNSGYKNMGDWMKAALMFRIGVLKIWWDTSKSVKQEQYEGLDDNQYHILISDTDIEIIEDEEYPDPDQLQLMENLEEAKVSAGAEPTPEDQLEAQLSALPRLHDVTVKRITEKGQVKVQAIPPEEYLFEEFKVDQSDRHFHCHRRRLSASELREMGFDEDIIEQIPFEPYDNKVYRIEPVVRHWPEFTQPATSEVYSDKSSWKADIFECYWYVDKDGDGIAEYHKTICGGPQCIVLEDDIVDDHCFAIITPTPIPFKMVGKSTFDDTKDLQDLKSVLMRQVLNNTYTMNQSRLAIDADKVNFDDVLNPAPGGPIRVKGAPGESVMPVQTTPIASMMMPLLQYVDQIREQRTGISPYSQGLSADELNYQTATGTQLMLTAGAMRQEAIAREFAEGFKRAFRRILDLVVKHQSNVDSFSMKGKFYQINPRDFDTDFDLVCEVGIGTGNRDIEMQRIASMMPYYQQIIQMQGGVKGPIVNLDNIYNALQRYTEAAGLKNPNLYFTDPQPFLQKQAQMQATQPPPQKPIDPNMLALAKMEQVAKEQTDRRQFEIAKTQADLAFKKQALQAEYDFKQKQLELEALREFNKQNSDKQDGELTALGILHSTMAGDKDRRLDTLREANDQHNARLGHSLDLANMHRDQFNQLRNGQQP